jgi:hypothetical protein
MPRHPSRKRVAVATSPTPAPPPPSRGCGPLAIFFALLCVGAVAWVFSADSADLREAAAHLHAHLRKRTIFSSDSTVAASTIVFSNDVDDANADATEPPPPQPSPSAAPSPLPACDMTAPIAPNSYGSFDDPCFFGASRQPPPDAFTRSLYPVPDAASVGMSGRTPTAYILTVNTTMHRYRYTAVRAAASGMQPVPHFGTWPRTDTIRNNDWRKLCATRFAHKTAWQRHAQDPAAGEDDWAFFFEDDVNIVQPLRGPSVHLLWRRAAEHAEVRKRGIMYLGYCAATDVEGSVRATLIRADEPIAGGAPLGINVDMTIACGSCQHAYGLTKAFARRFWDLGLEVVPHGDDSCNATYAAERGASPAGGVVNADTSVIYTCLDRARLNGIPNVGVNLVSPQNQHQVGPFFQDRSKFASSLDASNYGGASSTVGLKDEPTIEDARRRLRREAANG